MTRLEPRNVAARLTWMTAPGTSLDPETRRVLAEGAGGFVLFRRNIESVDQVARLCAAARAAAGGPLRIAVDQEGGHVLRLAEPLTRMPSLMGLGATGDADLAHRVARASGRELRALGIDTAFGPVLDLAASPASVVVGARSFGSDPTLVGEMGRAMVAGYRAGGVLSVAKHFPGHGRTDLDSHVDLPLIGGDADQLRAQDLVPFRAAVRGGVDALMVGHCVYPALGDEPATVSGRLLTELARRHLHFSGLLITDGLIMDAIAARYGVPEGACRALAAGVDALLPLWHQEKMLAVVAAALADGLLTGPQIERRLLRHAALEARVRSFGPLGGRDPAARIARWRDEHSSLADEAAERSLTLVDGPEPRLDPDSPILVIELEFDRPSPVEDETARYDVAAILATHLPGATVRTIGTSELGDPETVIGLHRGPAVLITRDHARIRGLRGLARAMAVRGPLVHVAMRSPHDLAATAGLGATRIAAYSDTPPTMKALARRLSAGGRWTGALPVPDEWVAAVEPALAVA